MRFWLQLVGKNSAVPLRDNHHALPSMDSTVIGLLTILGSLVTALLGAFYGARSYFREQAKREHLAEIKNRCLKPILRSIESLNKEIMWEESSYPSRAYIESEPWTKHLEAYKYRVDRALFEDLRHHFPALYRQLRTIEEETARKKMVDYKKREHKLASAIWLYADEQISSSDETKLANLLIASLNEILGYGKDYYPNVCKAIENWGLVPHLNNILEYFRDKDDVRRLVVAHKEINSELEQCISTIRKVLLHQKLSGKCEYL